MKSEMIAAWICAVIGGIYSGIYYGQAPSATDVFTGFIAGILIDFYIIYRQKNGSEG
ncbi:hypothetical protein J7E79_28065 [Bacillus sp. ISL-40]|uniref:hypothetical protein n=1 Tax=Bacillus sp. ISL-40 TaxID=2819126 RepID=UPI001BE59685|nr:hypothetical protein [Bacillus sp. ISL-40]MBT2701144.1 hypothetical protein [Bacillus sp. ISL-40]